MPLVRRTRQIFRKAEFGFFGVVVETLIATPRLKGLPLGSLTERFLLWLNWLWRAGTVDLWGVFLRPLRTSWLIVGIKTLLTVNNQ